MLPYCVMSNSSSQLGSRSLNDILGRYHNSRVISHYSNSVQLKFPIAFLTQKFSFQHHEPGSGLPDPSGGSLVCFSTATSSSLGSSGQDWLTCLWALSSSHFFLVCWGGEKGKGERIVVSYLTGTVVIFSLLITTTSQAMVLPWRACMHLLVGSVGGLPSAQSLEPDHVHGPHSLLLLEAPDLANSPFCEVLVRVCSSPVLFKDTHLTMGTKYQKDKLQY